MFALFSYFYIELVTRVHSFSNLIILLFGCAFTMISLLAKFGHEFGHGSILKSTSLNDFFFMVVFTICGVDHALWKYTHNIIHHPLPNIPGHDGDIVGNNLLRMGPHEEHVNSHKYMYLYAPFLYSLFFLNKFIVKDFKTYKKVSNRFLKSVKQRRYLLNGILLRKFCYLVLALGIPTIFLPYSFGSILLTFLLFHLISSIAIGFILGGSHSSMHNNFQVPNKDSFIDQSYFRHQIETAVDFHATNKVFLFFFGSTNAHVAHHLFPTMSSAHYGEVSKILQELCPKYEIKYTNLSFTQYIIGHWKYLKESSFNSDVFLQTLKKTDSL
jgi:linoleoyl-CoA desaturase